MNHRRVYDRIIASFRERNVEEGEKHHIVPRSLGGSDDQSNIVKLSYRAHFICHLLLVKIHLTGEAHRKMVYALHRMTGDGKHASSSTIYEFARREFVRVHSDTMNELVRTGKHRWLGGEVQRRTAAKQIAAGTHNFLGSELQQQRLAGGTHHFLNSELQGKNGSKGGKSSVTKQIAAGTHVFLGGKIQSETQRRLVKEGKHCFSGPAMNKRSWADPAVKQKRSEGISRMKRLRAAQRRIASGKPRHDDERLVQEILKFLEGSK